MVKQKKVSKMKSSEIVNELYDFEDEKRGDELDEELRSRYPFNYFDTMSEETENKLKSIEEQLNKLITHTHKDGKVLVEI